MKKEEISEIICAYLKKYISNVDFDKKKIYLQIMD